MGKRKLIDERTVRDLNAAGGKVILTDADTVLTPSARDAIRSLGMRVQEKGEAAAQEQDDQVDPELIYKVLSELDRRGMLGDRFKKDRAPAHRTSGDAGLSLADLNDMIDGLVRAMKGE